MHDVRLALRSLRATPVVSVVAALSLALGIGANTAIFSLVNSLLLRSLPVAEPHRLVIVDDSSTTSGHESWTYAVWDNIRQRAEAFDGAITWSSQRFNLAQGGETRPVDGMYVSGQYFQVLGVPALVGRTIGGDDDVRGGGRMDRSLSSAMPSGSASLAEPPTSSGRRSWSNGCRSPSSA
jgi:putative ABC transport system permease protein